MNNKRAKNEIDMKTSFTDKTLVITKDEFDYLCSKLSHLDALITSEDIKKINDITFKIIKNDENLFNIAHMFPDPPPKVKKALDSELLWKPDDSIVDFKYYDDIHQPSKTDMRYMINQQLKNLNEKDPQHAINKQLFEKLASQSRFTGLWREILIALIYRDQITEAQALQNVSIRKWNNKERLTYDLITHQSIAYILKKLEFYPFYHRGNRLILINNPNGSTGVISLLFSLLELSKEERMFNTIQELTELIIIERAGYATISFESLALKHKSKYSSLIQVVTTSLKDSVKVKYVGKGEVEDHVVNLPEINLECLDAYEINNGGWKKIWPELERYLQCISKEKDLYKRTETARWLITWLLIAGNPGIFFRTSLLLEYEKSVGPQINNVFETPVPDEKVLEGNLEFITSYKHFGNDTLKKVAIQFNEILEKYIRKIKKPEEHFVSILTANSQGQKVEPKDVHVRNLPEIFKNINSVKQLRLASFAYDRQPYEAYSSFKQALLSDGKCTIRFQNNRRARIVEMVPNVDQTAWQLVLMLFELWKHDERAMAVGKQKGSVFDMLPQLQATGTIGMVSLFSDISGADASVQPIIGTLFAQLMAMYLIKNGSDISKYFSCADTEYVTLNGKSVKIPALAKCLLTVIACRNQKNYELLDAITKQSLLVKPAIFESGRYDTSAQHTMMFLLLQRCAEADVKMSNPAFSWTIAPLKFGDDSYESLTSKTNVENLEDLVAYINKSNYHMKQLGFKMENAASRYVGDFLQQMAFNGRVISKSARSSVFTDERQQTSGRDILDRIDVMLGVIHSAAQRGYAPENLVTMSLPLWNLLRFVIFPAELRGRFSSLSHNPYFVYPLELIFYPPYNAPNPNLYLEGVYLPRSGYGRTVGTSKLVWILNKIMLEEEKRSVILGGSTYEIAKDKLEALGILHAMIITSQSRNAKLSRTRSELLDDEIEQMAATLKDYMDNNKLTMSYHADEILKAKGFEVPDVLKYHLRPKSRIQDMFASAVESELERSRLDDEMIRYLNRFSKDVPIAIKRKITAAGIWFTQQETTTGFNIISKFPLMAGYRENDYYDRLIKILGHPIFSRSNVTRIANFDKYGNGFPFEKALLYGAKAKTLGDDILSLYLDLLAIPDSLKEKFNELLVEFETVPITDDYTTGFNKSEFFGISGDAEILKMRLNIVDLPQAFIDRAALYLRDYLIYDVFNVDNCNFEIALSNDTLKLLLPKFYRRLYG